MSAPLILNELCVRCSQVLAKAEILFTDGTLEARNDFYPIKQWRANATWCHLCALSLHHADDWAIDKLQSLWDQGRGRETVINVKISSTTRENILSVLFSCDEFPILSLLYVDLCTGK